MMNPFRRDDPDFERALSDPEYRAEYLDKIARFRTRAEVVGCVQMIGFFVIVWFGDSASGKFGASIVLSLAVCSFMSGLKFERDIRLLMVHEANSKAAA